MSDKDYIKDLFSEKLAQHQAPVRADMWQGIQSQIGNAGAAAATKGLSLASKWIIGITSSVAITGAAVWMIPVSERAPEKEIKQEVQVENTLNQQEKIPSESTYRSKTSVLEQAKETPDESKGPFAGMDWAEDKMMGSGSPVQHYYPKEAAPAAADKTVTDGSIVADGTGTDKGIKRSEAPKARDASGSSEVQEKQEKIAESYVGRLVNVITPNGDNENDYLFIETKNLLDFQLTILNDKNEVIYSSADPDFKWIGVDKYGNSVPAGQYFYYLTAVDRSGEKVNRYSPLQIIR